MNKEEYKHRVTLSHKMFVGGFGGSVIMNGAGPDNDLRDKKTLVSLVT